MLRPFPLSSQGPLPPRLPARLLARALKYLGYPTAFLLQKIGAPPARRRNEEAALRKALDHAPRRARLQALCEHENLLANALYRYMFHTSKIARDLDAAVFKAASVDSGGKSYLDVDQFQRQVTATDSKALVTEEFCLLVLAFGILQPEAADAIVTIASRGNPLVESFFRLHDNRRNLSDVAPIVIEAPGRAQNSSGGHSSPTPAFEPSALPAPDKVVLATSTPNGTTDSTWMLGAALDELSLTQQTALLELQRVLEQYAEASAKVHAASSNGAWDEVPGLVEQVKDIERQGRLTHSQLASTPGGEQLTWVQSPPSGQQESIARCEAVAEVLRNARRQQALRLEHERILLMRLFEDVELRVPDAVAHATSLEALSAIKRASSADLQRASALKKFLAAPELSAKVLHDYAPETRMEVYVLAAHHPRAVLSAQVFACLVDDAAAMETDTVRAQELILAETLLRLERNEALPTGTWNMLSRLVPEAWISRLVESEVPSRLVLAPRDAIDADGLVVALAPHILYAELPTDLRRLVQHEAAKRLPPQERINALNELAKEQPNDRVLLLDLFDALATTGRSTAAFLLAVAATRAGVIDALPTAVHDAVRVVLLNAATKGAPQARDVALLLVSDPEWLAIDVNGATLVLLMSWTLGVDELYHRVRYEWPDMFAQTVELRPVLVGEWLVPCLEGRDPVGVDERRRAIQREARDLLDAFDLELKRQTFFNKWEHAKGYMTLIKEKLRAVFAQMERGEALEPTDLSSILRQGSQVGLPEIDGHRVMLAMEAYMCEQRLRIEALATIRATLGQPVRESIEIERSPLRERMAAEGRLPSNGSALMQQMYAHVLEGM